MGPCPRLDYKTHRRFVRCTVGSSDEDDWPRKIESTMKRQICLSLALAASCVASLAQQGPFNPEQWPPTINAAKIVHYVATDGDLQPPSDKWLSDPLTILTGGDQGTDDITVGGHMGKKVVGDYLNIADAEYPEWADTEVIDILTQVYGNAALLNAQGEPRDYHFLTGTLPAQPEPYLVFPVGGQIPVEAKNSQWNWVLFRITNGIRPDGERFVGSVAAAAQGGTQFGGVNGGTIRFEQVSGLTVRVVAFGEQGAFGEPDAINKFAAAETCDPEPNTNLAGIDLAAGTTNHLEILNNGDQTVTFQDNVGPTGSQRKAVRANGTFLNVGITDNYLGKPCNDPRVVKICVDYYDDPALTGVKFGPEAYATDNKGGIATFPNANWQELKGTGTWQRRSWSVGPVNLFGVNTTPLTGGPRLGFEGGQVSISRIDMAVLRVGDHPLANQDPLSECVEDPNICTDAYGNTVELDLGKDIRNGLDVGTSGGDQEMIVAEAGPASDRRQAVRAAREDGNPGFGHIYVNFAITGEALGPTTQPPAHIAICVTYYDDPALTGKRFKPEVYRAIRNGAETFAFTDDSYWVTLEGTDTWRDAYWEIPDVKFSGVNQGPQAAARFTSEDKIFLTRVRYAVIRPCGPNAGKNALAECKPAEAPMITVSRGANNTIRISWPVTADGYALESSATLATPTWQPVSQAPQTEGDQYVVTVTVQSTTYYRLHKP